MFERTRVDNSTDVKAQAAHLVLDDGTRLAGRFFVARSKNLVDVLNGPSQFVEFEPFDGERQILAKGAIRSLRIVSAPAGRNPATLIRDTDDFNPYDILGVKRGACRNDLRAAFHERLKAYHPDRYSAAELPTEVETYLATMARRINAAYEALVDEAIERDAALARRAEPVFESGPTA